MTHRLVAALVVALVSAPPLALADEPGPNPQPILQDLYRAAMEPVAEPASPPAVDPPEVAKTPTSSVSGPRPTPPPVDPSPTLRSDSIEFPFGEAQPVVTCTPLRACDIELQAGEQIHGIALGDTERWLASPLFSGAPEALVPHVVVKPRDHDLATNLVIATTRRTYHVSLVSPPKAQAASTYIRRVTFRYPDELVATWTRLEDLRAASAEREAQRLATPLEAPSLTDLNFGYKVELPRGTRPEWTPVRVFDDGRRTYFEMPRALKATDAPALFALEASGGTAVVNYRVAPNGTWWIADGVYDSMRLLLGVGRSQRAVTISRTAR